jgi:hypothetical protein
VDGRRDAVGLHEEHFDLGRNFRDFGFRDESEDPRRFVEIGDDGRKSFGRQFSPKFVAFEVGDVYL